MIAGRIFFIAIVLLSLNSYGQSKEKTDSLILTGYVEIYYLYDLNKPENGTVPGFLYSYNRANEFNLNLGFIKGAYTSNKLRANIALMTGTYTNANLGDEPGVLKNIFEANAGVKLSASKDIWIDAGIFPSHIGFESAIGKDCWNLTRSILADNSPYYESGVKVSYTTGNNKWFLSGLILNGWQTIQRVEGNTLPSFGTQLTFKPSSVISLNSSSFIGTDKPDSAQLMRYFHNFYCTIQLSKKLGMVIGFDNGWEEKVSPEKGYAAWYSPVMILRAKINEKIVMTFRGEYFEDQKNVIVKWNSPASFTIKGISINMDYLITSNAIWRIEVRNFSSKNAFIRNGMMVDNNTFISTALAVGF